ncbi:hypothetical protein [Streptomyces sp. XD-27]|uniref:hypothetical protein n=1 Tax=Streptomyces sp. XD-27 TaxID=3062779 RepID=UPI0026F419AA|nr:hypothetical protein [Streptomyces sp. XD-27]WKX70647.1 hypothetical protein Q3Y56_12650 [Streptomyces sp. XD-27]
MERSHLDAELSRLKHRPSGQPVPLLGVFTVVPAANGFTYAARIRELLLAAVSIARSADFDQDDVSPDSLPAWFLSHSTGETSAENDDRAGSEGKASYERNRGERPWTAEEWLYCFDPDLRSWSWWDVTADKDGHVRVWVDTKGEGHIPCEELWWAVYVAGASEVRTFTLEYASAWQEQQSLSEES